VNLAHGVGRMYQLPVPLEYYLGGSALAVLGSLVVVARTRQARSSRGPRMLLGTAATLRLARVLRVVVQAGFLFAFISAAVGFDATFSFAALWVWMGLVVFLVVINVIFGGIWRLADPWVPLARAWSGELEEEEEEDENGGVAAEAKGGSRSLPSILGPLSIYLLFWFELVSRVGFDAPWLVAFLASYVVYAVWIRAGTERWELLDPFCILYEFASRASFLQVTEAGTFVEAPGRKESEQQPMPVSIYAALFLLLGATSMDNLRETQVWFSVRRALGMPDTGISPLAVLLYDSVALAMLAVPFFISFYLGVRLTRRLLKVESSTFSRVMAWSLAPIGIAYLLAHNAALFVVTLPLWLRSLADPLALGWRPPGGLFSEFDPSPALVWFVEVGLVVGGHIIGVLMAHRLEHRFVKSQNGASLASQIPFTVLMSLYTVGTLWLLSLAVVVPAN
jgi:hypothetical protein